MTSLFKRFGVTFLVLSLALSVAACKKKETAAADSGGKGKGGKRGLAQLSYPVEVMTVETKSVEYVVNAPGTIDAFERVQITARVAGAVDKVAFVEGQMVKKGDALVVIDSERYRLAVNSAMASVAKAQASQKDIEAAIERRSAASEKNPGLIPGEELEGYKTKGLTAKADTDLAYAALRSAQVNLRDSSVRSPMDGIIQTRTIETGQYVQAGYVMATILRAEPLLLRFPVTTMEAARIKPGAMATFTMRETTRTYNAKVTLVAGAADETSRMVSVTAEVQEEGHKFWLKPGSFCDVTLQLEAPRPAPVVPRAAIRPSERGFIAYVVEEDVAKERILQLGLNTKDGWVEVRDGLKAGDVLVVKGAEPLVNGSKVRLPGASPSGSAEPNGSGSRRFRPADSSGAPATSGSGRRGGRGPKENAQ